MRSIIKQTEQEYGLPYWDVVKGFADDGYSATATAGILGYSHACPFLRLLTRHGKREWFSQGQDTVIALEARESRRGKCTEAMHAALRRASAANPGYKRITFNGTTDTIAGHASRIGISTRTAYHRARRRPGDWDYVFSKNSHYVPPPAGKGWQAWEFRI